jgi:hypothetical protein
MATASRILGVEVGSTAPAFLAILTIHVIAGLTAVITGAAAALARKGSPRHIRAGRGYYRAITAVFATAVGLAAMRWARDYYLFILGAVAFTAATTGYLHRRHGDLLHRHAHRVLRRQRAAPAAVGPAARPRFLDPARHHRRARHHPRDHPRQEQAAPPPAQEPART